MVMLFGLVLAWFSQTKQQEVLEIIPTITNFPSNIPSILPTPTAIFVPEIKPSISPQSHEEWGVAKQVDEHTWTMKVGMDEKMSTPKELFDALNEYRRRYGVAVLIWDDKLADYALTRANYFNKIGKLDGHAGFANFLENENGFDVLGFDSMGENISFGYKMSGTHLIEWIYAGDKPHDDNQKNAIWAYVGIGVDKTATCLIFATGKR